MNNFVYGDFDASEHGLIVLDKSIYGAPERDVEFITVPGRNGDLAKDNGRFKNIEITYHCVMVEGFANDFSVVKRDLKLMTGYQRLEDTFDSGVYRMALMHDTIEPRIKPYNDAAKFDIVFNCKPQRFLGEGDEIVEYSLVSSGGIDAETGADVAQDYRYRVEYTPVTPGTLFEASVTYQGSVANTLLVAWYDSSKTFISSQSAGETYLTDWEQGLIRESNGSDNDGISTRCRTPSANAYNYDGVSNVTITVASGYKLGIREYSGFPCTSDNYVGAVSFATGTITFAPVTGHYYRYVIGLTTDGTLTPSAISSDAVLVAVPIGDVMTLSLVVPSNAAYARVMYGFGTGTYIGSTGLTISNNGVETHYGDGGVLLINPTGFDAEPRIYLRVTGAATLTVEHLSPINAITVTTVAIDDFTDTGRNDIVIDSVIGDSYSQYFDALEVPMSLNNYVSITEGTQFDYADFPKLEAGRTIISTPSTVTSIKVQAGWWTV